MASNTGQEVGVGFNGTILIRAIRFNSELSAGKFTSEKQTAVKPNGGEHPSCICHHSLQAGFIAAIRV